MGGGIVFVKEYFHSLKDFANRLPLCRVVQRIDGLQIKPDTWVTVSPLFVPQHFDCLRANCCDGAISHGVHR